MIIKMKKQSNGSLSEDLLGKVKSFLAENPQAQSLTIEFDKKELTWQEQQRREIEIKNQREKRFLDLSLEVLMDRTNYMLRGNQDCFFNEFEIRSDRYVKRTIEVALKTGEIEKAIQIGILYLDCTIFFPKRNRYYSAKEIKLRINAEGMNYENCVGALSGLKEHVSFDELCKKASKNK